MEEQHHKGHQARHSGRKAAKKKRKAKDSAITDPEISDSKKSKKDLEKAEPSKSRNPKAFTFKSAVKAAKLARRYVIVKNELLFVLRLL